MAGSISALDKMKNIAVRTKASGERRVTFSRNDKTAEALAKADTPAAMGKLAVQHGISVEEILERGRKSPNFGQFRMVLGNRIRGVVKRRKENPSLSMADAANPPKRSRASSGKKVGKKVAKKTGKKVSKVGRG